MIIRVSIANLDVMEASKLGQESGFPGTVYANIGFGSWGVEHGVTFEFDGVSQDTISDWTVRVLAQRNEQAAYAVVDGHPYLWYREHTEDLAA